MPAVEVTGGCFCCDYDDLGRPLDVLACHRPTGCVFAESVGSCADLVATVVKPLRPLHELACSSGQPVACSPTAACCCCACWPGPCPSATSVIYIFDQQIEEADLLVLNKIDLLSSDEREQIHNLARARYPGKKLLLQNALAAEQLHAWLKAIQPGRLPLPTQPLDIDYQRYGQGEAELAWLDKELTLQTPPGAARQVAIHFIEQILGQLGAAQAAVAHLKLLITCGTQHTKLSITASSSEDWRANLPQFGDEPIQIEFNARVQIDPPTLDFIFSYALASAAKIPGVQVQAAGLPAFKPGFPKPTHRIAGSN